MSRVPWEQFVLQMGPPALELLQDLFTKHGGDPVAAKEEIKRIRDHGSRTLDPARAQVNTELDELRKQGK